MCIRIDSYESEEAQKIVRSYLNGRFANTAFCLLAPDGKTRLTRGHRGPSQVLGPDLAKALHEVADRYEVRGPSGKAAVPDFPNFRLGLNVASADQRMLVLVTGNEQELTAARKKLTTLANHDKLIGRFHYDFESDASAWRDSLSGDPSTARIKFIIPDEFGQKGEILASLPLNTPLSELGKAMVKANEHFAKTAVKKNYRDHVRKGKREGIEWTMPMEFGEDRDGDGKIDHRRGRPQ